MSSVDDLISSIERKDDGHFLIENRNDRAWICIHPPGPGGMPVRKPDVLARLKLFGIEDYDLQKLEELLILPDGQWHELGTWKEPESQDARFSIEIAPDKKSATLTVEGPIFRGRWIDRSELDAAILAAGIRAGVDEDLLDAIASRSLDELKEKGPYRKTYTIARAIDSTPASDGRIQFYFDPHPRARPALIGDSPNARVDFKKLGIIQTCEKDQLIAELVDPVEGRPGLDVTGNPVYPEKPVEAHLEAGRNVTLKEKKLYSLSAGQVIIRYDEEKNYARVEVVEVLDVESVDYGTGNIDFPGTVVIHDTVADGFQVKARGDIIVERTVSNALLQAEGDIVLMGGAVGRGAGFIEAGQDVYAKFVQETTVSAGHGIYIEEAALHSRLMAGVEIRLDGGRGDLIGGSALSGKLLVANRIGSKAEPETRLTLGIDPETFRRLRELDQEIDRNRTTLKRIQQHRRHLEEMRRRAPSTAGQDPAYDKLVILENKFLEIISNLDRQRETIQAAITPDRQCAVIYRDTVFPNVEISFGYGIRKYRIDRRPVALPGRFSLDPVENKILHSFD
jgi:uncharacterized protein (DUF342 family)